MQKFSVKYWQTEFNNISKRSYIMIKGLSSQGCEMLQQMQIIKHNSTYLQKPIKKHKITSTDAEKSFIKIQHCFMITALMRLKIEGMYLTK
jgi:hypothetical protein